MRLEEDVQAVEAGKRLPLMEAFYTIQWEGIYTGQAAYFIRLAGCDVGCVWCDVKESWEESDYPVVAVDEIVKEAARYPSKIAVITGGEPGMYNLNYLSFIRVILSGQKNMLRKYHPIAGSYCIPNV